MTASFSQGGQNSKEKEFRSSGVQEFRSSGVQEFRSSGVQEFRSSGVQEFRSSGVQEFSVERHAGLQAETVGARYGFHRAGTDGRLLELLQLLELLNSFFLSAILPCA
jgi:hypothetical protein